MFIPSDTYKRRTYRREGSQAYACGICSNTFVSRYGYKQHLRKHDLSGHDWPSNALRFSLPQVSISLHQTCRIVRLETGPIIYSKNVFHFSDPTTASNLRWSSDSAQAGAIREIGIRFSLPIGNVQVKSWTKYFTKQTLSCAQEFPHLRRMTIDLEAWGGSNPFALFRALSEGFRRRSQALECVYVFGVYTERFLDCFEPLVDREDDSLPGKKGVQRHGWGDPARSSWQHALLWWGHSGEQVPQTYRYIGGQPQY